MLKRIVIIVFSFFLNFNSVNSNDLKIAYVDVDGVINQSTAGKNLSKQIEAINKTNIEKFKKKEKELAEEEKKLIKQKNVLSPEDFKKKVTDLQKNIKIFKKEIFNAGNDLDKKRLKATNNMLKVLNPILSEYSAKNSISLIIQKKSIVVGKADLDISSQILEILNTKIKTVKLD
tara:strand:+ start:5771 stop:6295 length:525 start_codon:yes stop_codon:yes gene_type:complete